MFTGLIQQTGILKQIDSVQGGFSLVVAAAWDPALTLGESIAVQGACLTVARVGADWFACDVLRETLNKTNLEHKSPGARLNLERALRVGDPLDGHIVSGHVDGTGVLHSVANAGRDKILTIKCGESLISGMVSKGSVCCDGVSLTIAALEADRFSVHLIPTTWRKTTLQYLKPGSSVNIETDMLGKYALKQMQQAGAASRKPVSMDMLEKAGFF